MLTTGGGWLVAAAAVAALILVLVKDSVPWTVLRTHLPQVTWDKQAGPKPPVRPKQEPEKPATPDAGPEASKSKTPAPPVAQPQIRSEDERRTDKAPQVPQPVAPDKSASSLAEATGAASVQPAPASSAAPATRFEAASVKKSVAPSYPRLARDHRIEGQVLVRASVGTDGRIRKVEIVEGNPILAEAAADAMRQWRYEPARLDGVPVPCVVMATIRFVFAA